MTSTTLKIQDYCSLWPEEFAQIGRELRSVLGDHAQRIDHIGSTSVPGLAAKDIIDIQVTVVSLVQLAQKMIGSLSAKGFRLHPHAKFDHVPIGFPNKLSHWQKLLFQQPEGERRINIHVREMGRPNQRYALLFRDYLRSNPIASERYAAYKRLLCSVAASLSADDGTGTYLVLKDPVVDFIMDTAEQWAVTHSWRLGPSDA